MEVHAELERPVSSPSLVRPRCASARVYNASLTSISPTHAVPVGFEHIPLVVLAMACYVVGHHTHKTVVFSPEARDFFKSYDLEQR